MAGRQRPHKQKVIEAVQVYGECSSRCLGTGVSWLTLAERGAQAAGGRVNAGGDVGSKTTRRTKEWTATTERKHRARAVCSAAEVVPGCCSGWWVVEAEREGGVVVVMG